MQCHCREEQGVLGLPSFLINMVRATNCGSNKMIWRKKLMLKQQNAKSNANYSSIVLGTPCILEAMSYLLHYNVVKQESNELKARLITPP